MNHPIVEEVIDGLTNVYAWHRPIIECSRDPEHEDAVFIKLSNGLTFHVTIRMLEDERLKKG